MFASTTVASILTLRAFSTPSRPATASSLRLTCSRVSGRPFFRFCARVLFLRHRLQRPEAAEGAVAGRVQQVKAQQRELVVTAHSRVPFALGHGLSFATQTYSAGGKNNTSGCVVSLALTSPFEFPDGHYLGWRRARLFKGKREMREHISGYWLATYTGKRSAYLFHHAFTRKNGDLMAGERIHSCRTAFLRAIREAELPAGFVPHDLRHRRVATWLAAGKGVTLVKEAVGHADLATTMRYTHLVKENLLSLVDEEPSREQLKELGS